MKLINSKGTVILEREKPQSKRTHFSPMLNSKSIKKTHRPSIVNKEVFFKNCLL